MFSTNQIKNSKNTVSNATLNANGDIVIGDSIITNIYNNTEYEKLCEQEKDLLEDIQFLSNLGLTETTKKKIDTKQITLNLVLTQKQSFEHYVIKLAIKLTNISIDEDKQEQVKRLFQEGKYAEIEKVFDIRDLKREQISLLKATELKHQELEELEDKRKKNAETYLILASLAALKFDSSTRFEDTCRCFEEAIVSYESAYNYYQYGVFLHSNNQFDKAKQVYSTIIDKYFNTIDDKLKGGVLNDYANILRNFRQLEEAEKTFEEAINIRIKLTLENPEQNEFDLASSYNNMGILKKQMNELAESKRFQKKAVEIRKKIIERFSKNNISDEQITDKQYYADTLLNLANVHVPLLEWQEAEDMLNKAFELRKELDQEIGKDKILMQITNLYGYYMILNSFGILCLNKREFNQSYKYFTDAGHKLDELLKLNRLKYFMHKGELICNISLVESGRDNYKEAKLKGLQGIEIYKELTSLNEKTYKPDLAIAYNNLGAIAKHHKDLDCAEESLKKALEIRRDLVKSHSKAYNLNVSNTLNSLGITYFLREDFENAEICYREALLIRQQLVNEGNTQYIVELGVTLNDLGILLANKGGTEAYQESLNLLEKALEIRQELVTKNRKAFLIYLKETQVNMGVTIYKLKKDLNLTLKYFEDSLDNAILELEPFTYEKLKGQINETLLELKINKKY